MNVIAIVQARMGSKRLPGKVMREINGKPLIGYLLDRLRCSSELDGIIVAIPETDKHSTLAEFVTKAGFPLYAGCEEHDVASRFLAVIDEIKPDAFVRICADSPLIDPQLVNDVVKVIRQNTMPFLTTVGGITPHGQYIEAVATKFYLECSKSFTKEDREHAGFPFFYRMRPRLCVDTEEDFTRIKRVIEQMTADHVEYGMEDCLNLARLQ